MNASPRTSDAPVRAHDLDHRRLVRALWCACALAGAWLFTHDVGGDAVAAATPAAADTRAH